MIHFKEVPLESADWPSQVTWKLVLGAAPAGVCHRRPAQLPQGDLKGITSMCHFVKKKKKSFDFKAFYYKKAQRNTKLNHLLYVPAPRTSHHTCAHLGVHAEQVTMHRLCWGLASLSQGEGP